MVDVSRRALVAGGSAGVAAVGLAVAVAALTPRQTAATAEPRPAPPGPSAGAAPPGPPQPALPPVALGVPAQIASLLPRTSDTVLQQVVLTRTGELFSTQSPAGTAPGRWTTVITRSAGPAVSATGNPEIDAMVVIDGGHGIGLHVEPRPDGGHDVWASLQGAVPQSDPLGGRLARFAYTPGVHTIDAVPGGVAWAPQMPNDQGAVQEAVYGFDADRGLVVERMYDFATNRDERYTLRRLDDLLAGADRPLGRLRVPVDPPTMQGFATVDGRFFRWLGAGNGGSGAEVQGDPMVLEQWDWVTGQRIAVVPFPALGQVGGAWRDGAYEPEGCSVHREADGSPSLVVSVTTGRPRDHAWPVFRIGVGVP